MRFKLTFKPNIDDEILLCLSRAGKGGASDCVRVLVTIGILVDEGKVHPLNLSKAKNDQFFDEGKEVNLILKDERDFTIVSYLNQVHPDGRSDAVNDRAAIGARILLNKGVESGLAIVESGMVGRSDDLDNHIDEEQHNFEMASQLENVGSILDDIAF